MRVIGKFYRYSQLLKGFVGCVYWLNSKISQFDRISHHADTKQPHRIYSGQ